MQFILQVRLNATEWDWTDYETFSTFKEAQKTKEAIRKRQYILNDTRIVKLVG